MKVDVDFRPTLLYSRLAQTEEYSRQQWLIDQAITSFLSEIPLYASDNADAMLCSEFVLF